jgi:hypothetical protein
MACSDIFAERLDKAFKQKIVYWQKFVKENKLNID